MDLIEDAQAYVAERSDCTLLPTQYQITLPCFPSMSRWPIYLPRPPLVSVDSVEYLDTEGQLTSLEGFRAATMTFSALFPGHSWPQTMRVADAVRIKYTAGVEASCPRPAMRAIMLLVGHWFMTREDSTEMRLEKIPHGVDAICLQLRPGDDFQKPVDNNQSQNSNLDGFGRGYYG